MIRTTTVLLLLAGTTVAAEPTLQFDWTSTDKPIREGRTRVPLAQRVPSGKASEVTVLHRVRYAEGVQPLAITVTAVRPGDPSADVTLTRDANGLGVSGGDSERCNAGEAILVRFNADVLVESGDIHHGDHVSGGSFQVGDGDPLAIDGSEGPLKPTLLKAGEVLRFDATGHEGRRGKGPAGNWRLVNVVVRPRGKPIEAIRAADESPGTVEPDATGRLLLAARHATAHGAKLLYETQPWKDTVGYWVNADDWAEWSIAAKPGRYRVRILQGCGNGQGGSRARIVVGEASLEFEVVETGHFQNFRWRSLGEITVAKGAKRLELRVVEKAKNAVMDCRAIELVPVEP